MNDRQQSLLTDLGFRFGVNGTHAARTMMLDDLRMLLEHAEPGISRSDFARLIIDDNVLGKPTKKARELAYRHLSNLYALDPENPIFRVMRQLWPLNPSAQPLLALGVALARDPLLKMSVPFIQSFQLGQKVDRELIEQFIASSCPDRFSAASLKSFAQNLGGTWTAAGYLKGHRNKQRAKPDVTPEATVLFLFLGHLEGKSGQRVLGSDWIKLLELNPDEVMTLATSASHKGLLVFMAAGGVVEVRFPDFLNAEEERKRNEVVHVI